MIKRYDENDIDKLIEILKNNGVISVPTDTVFGICARTNSEIALSKLMEIKDRPQNKTFPIMCADEYQINEFAIINKNTEKIIKAFMPGPITLILKMKENVPYLINNVRGTIAVRMATSDILKQLIKHVGCPVYMSSANQSGKPVCTNLDDIEKACPNLDAILDGTVKYNISSTIVDCTTNEVNILREGPVTKSEILEILNN